MITFKECIKTPQLKDTNQFILFIQNCQFDTILNGLIVICKVTFKIFMHIFVTESNKNVLLALFADF